jgi:hypothetical protein
MKYRVIAFLLLAGSILGPSFADTVIPSANGWTIDKNSGAFAFSPDGVAVAVYKYKTDPAPRTTVFAESRVIQVVNGSVVSEKDFLGKIVKLRYSPDGQKLLVSQRNPDLQDQRRLTLLNTAGTVLWTKDDTRSFRFSTTGEVIFATRDADRRSRLGKETEIFDLNGTSMKEVTFEMSPQGVLVRGSGNQTIIAVAATILALEDSQSALTTAWRLDLGEPDIFAGMAGLRALDDQRFVLNQLFGRFKIISTSGQDLYSFDPGAIAENDPNRTSADYSEFEAFALGTSEDILLFDGTTRGFSLDVSTGVLTPRILNAGAPADSVVKKWVEHDKMLILSDERITIRPLAYLGQ